MTISPVWASYDLKKDLWTLQIHVQPGARNSTIVGEYNGRLKLKIAAPAVDNRANDALMDFLAKLFGVGARQVSLVRGENARQKTIAVQGAGSQVPDLLEKTNQEYRTVTS